MTEIPDGWVRVDEPEPGDRVAGARDWSYVGPSRSLTHPHVVELVDGTPNRFLETDRVGADTVWLRRVPTVTIELEEDVASRIMSRLASRKDIDGDDAEKLYQALSAALEADDA